MNVSLVRSIQAAEGDEERVFPSGATSATVSGGRFTATARPDDKKLEELLSVDNSLGRVSDQLSVAVSFDPSSGQPTPIVCRIGATGAILRNSPQRDTIGTATADPVTQLIEELAVRLPMTAP